MKEQPVAQTTHAPIRTPDSGAGPDRSRFPYKGTLREQQCLRCDHRWWPRTPSRTLRCPRCKSPYWDRPRRTVQDVKKDTRIETGAAVATGNDKPARPREALSFAAALELLKTLKSTGRSWSELGQELQRHSGVQLEKDQLKALLR